MNTSSRPDRKKIIFRILTVAGIILLLILFLHLLVYLLSPVAAFRLKNKLYEASEGLYLLETDNLRISLLGGSIRSGEMIIHTDTTRYYELKEKGENPALLKVEIESLRISDATWLRWLISDELRINEIFIGRPVVKLETETEEEKEEDGDFNLDDLPEKIKDFAETLQIRNLHLDSGSFYMRSKDKEEFTDHSLHRFTLEFSEIMISTAETGKPFFSRELNFTGKEYSIKMHNGVSIKIDSAGFNSTSEIAELRRVEFLRPRPSEYARSEIEVEAEEVNLSGLDFYRLLHHQEVVVQRAGIAAVRLDAFKDNNLPKEPDLQRKMPNELFREIPVYLKVDTITIDQMDIHYAQIAEEKKEAGELSFRDCSFIISNFTNDKELMTVASPAIVQFSAKLYGQGKGYMWLEIPLLSESFRCSYSGSMEQLDMKVFNNLIVPLEDARIESGEIKSIDFQVEVRNGTAHGNMELVYENLQIQAIEDAELKEWAKTFLGNIILHSRNMPEDGSSVSSVDLTYERSPDDAFFRFVWRSVRNGIEETAVKSFAQELTMKKK